MRLLIAFLIPLMSFYLSLQAEEFENLLAFVVDEGLGFHPGLGCKFLAALVLPSATPTFWTAASCLKLCSSRHGMGFFTGESMLGFLERRFLPCLDSFRFTCHATNISCSSLVPRDLSLRNNF